MRQEKVFRSYPKWNLSDSNRYGQMSILACVAACIAGTFDNCGFRIADCGLQRTAAI